MASVFGWLDSSEHDRRRALDVIHQFEQRETVDELGLGGIRDTSADVLAPGTSTIQTRARYFFFIPWIYLALEGRKTQSGRVAALARQREINLIEVLSESVDPRGTIGIDAGSTLRRLPSAIYWAGLYRLGFRLTAGSQDQYQRVLERGGRAAAMDDSRDLVLDSNRGPTWHVRLPPPPDDFPGSASFALRRVEAEYFREALQVQAPDSLFQFLVSNERSMDRYDFPWQHPLRPAMPLELQRWLEHAELFSTAMHGAQLLYNLLLAEAVPDVDRATEYRDAFHEWTVLLEPCQTRVREWDRLSFWSELKSRNKRLSSASERFADTWIQLVLDTPSVGTLVDQTEARRLVALREHQLKGPRARLQSRAHLDLWGGASGTERLSYRWGITQTLVRDITTGLAS